MQHLAITDYGNYDLKSIEEIEKHILRILGNGIDDIDMIVQVIYKEEPNSILTLIMEAFRNLYLKGVVRREAYNLYWV